MPDWKRTDEEELTEVHFCRYPCSIPVSLLGSGLLGWRPGDSSCGPLLNTLYWVCSLLAGFGTLFSSRAQRARHSLGMRPLVAAGRRPPILIELSVFFLGSLGACEWTVQVRACQS